jgi:Ca2+-binding EF-hand superfamily protein
MKFAKEFFQNLDTNGTEKVEIEELALPLIALGLSSDISFVEKVIKTINPLKYANLKFSDEL